ncbi:MAG TPA: hypothetical protein VN634_19505 [Candidatus Limnocylindrales bacterium]|nr:hypothetical protein [Candidatus Limnocylindrales bacterium]
MSTIDHQDHSQWNIYGAGLAILALAAFLTAAAAGVSLAASSDGYSDDVRTTHILA